LSVQPARKQHRHGKQAADGKCVTSAYFDHRIHSKSRFPAAAGVSPVTV
jgi:hypothetical protein